jgi:dolichol-phosphate mannosyltransferase
MTVLVAIPCYRCGPQLERVFSEFDGPLLERIGEILVIDNQSPDETFQTAKRAAGDLHARYPDLARIQVIQNPVNVGLGGTHKVAFQYAEDHGYDYVAILHGDNQARTQELHHLLNIADREKQSDAVMGARFMPGSRRIGYSWLRTAGNFALNWLYTIFSGRRTYDFGSGLNLYKVSSFKDRKYLTFGNGLSFNMEFLLHYYSKNARIEYCPITWREFDQVSNARVWKMGWETVVILMRWRYGWGLK